MSASHIQASHIQASRAPVHKYGRAERGNKKKKEKKGSECSHHLLWRRSAREQCMCQHRKRKNHDESPAFQLQVAAP
eukprot:15069-Heterococcus_DN1.PRE.1